MMYRLICICCVLALFACDSKEPAASAEAPGDEASKSAADEDKASESEGDEEKKDEEAAAKKDDEDLQSKTCEEFYAYSRDVCLESLEDGLDVGCYQVVMKADSTRKLMAGEGAMAERTKDMSEEQKQRAFCGRFYERLAKKVAEADTEKVEHPAKCKEAIKALDRDCLQPVAAGKAYKDGCNSALQSVSRWQTGEKFCDLTINLLEK